MSEKQLSRLLLSLCARLLSISIRSARSSGGCELWGAPPYNTRSGGAAVGASARWDKAFQDLAQKNDGFVVMPMFLEFYSERESCASAVCESPWHRHTPDYE